MADWNEPKSDYTAGSQVTPAIFNTLAINEKHLKEISCKVEVNKKTGEINTVNGLVFVEV